MPCSRCDRGCRPYAQQLDAVWEPEKSIDPEENPLFRERPTERVALVVVTADRGGAEL